MSGSLSDNRTLSPRLGLPSGSRTPAETTRPTTAQYSDSAWADGLDKDMLFPSLSGRADWLQPIIRHMASGAKPILIATKAPANAGGVLTGRFALTRSLFRWIFPMPILTTWHNPQVFSGAPIVVARDHGSAAISAMLDAARRRGARAVLMNQVYMNQGMVRALDDSGADWRTTSAAERAALVCGHSFDDWISSNFSRKRRKEYRRLYARLSEQGVLDITTFTPGEDVQPWTEAFLHLERSGWKGERGTAIDCNPNQRNAMSDALRRLARSNDLMFWKMSLDDRPIAMLFAVRCGDTVGLGKIAFDESLGTYSPGVLMILEATRTLLSTPGVKLVDSHAAPDHPMINNIWRDRIPYADVILATPGTSPRLLTVLQRAEQGRRHLRQIAKSIYLQMLKRGPK